MDGLDLIRGSHAEGLRLLESALARDEEGDSIAALREYRQALAVMAMGLEVRCDLSHCEGAEWGKARKMQQEMRKRGVQTRGRIKDLERLGKSGLLLSPSSTTPTTTATTTTAGDHHRPCVAETRRSPPPPYSEKDENSDLSKGGSGCGFSSAPQPPPYSEFPEPSPSSSKAAPPPRPPPPPPIKDEDSSGEPAVHETLKASKPSEQRLDSPVECGIVEVTRELFRIDDGVRLFHVDPESQSVVAKKSSTTSSSADSATTTFSMSIFKLPTPKNRKESFDCLEYILQVDDWIFPLSQHLSPILKTVDSIYMFPDLKEEAASVACLATETAIGLVLDPSLVSLDVRFVFEEKLRELAFLLSVEEASSLGLVKSSSFSETDGAALSTPTAGAVSHHRVQPRGALAADFVARGMLTGATALSQGGRA